MSYVHTPAYSKVAMDAGNAESCAASHSVLAGRKQQSRRRMVSERAVKRAQVLDRGGRACLGLGLALDLLVGMELATKTPDDEGRAALTLNIPQGGCSYPPRIGLGI
jgi:hypothetical protein